jgi:hypothetical protein
MMNCFIFFHVQTTKMLANQQRVLSVVQKQKATGFLAESVGWVSKEGAGS